MSSPNFRNKGASTSHGFVSCRVGETTLRSGGGITFRTEHDGALPCTYQWQRDGAPVPGATDRELHLARVTPADAGNYQLRVENRHGHALSAPGNTLIVQP